MKQTETLVIGASISGLASACCLQKHGIDYIVIEKQSQVAAPWRNHYDRLHLHTNKRISSLPYKKFDDSVPRYPSRQQVIDYLEDYQREFKIHPIFHTEAKSIRKEGDYWITETNQETFRSKFVIMATGAFGKPKPVSFKGIEKYTGKTMHSHQYKAGKDFKRQKVLIVGFGNSACEIALDLYEQGAIPFISVRSPVNIIPRDILGIPILELSLLLSHLSPRIADTVTAPLVRLLFGDITKLGLKKLPYGPFEQIKKNRKIPVLDIGVIKHIRKGHITIYGDIDNINDKTVYFSGGKQEDFNVIVAAVGYFNNYAEIIDIEKTRLEDLKERIDKQKYFGKDGLYFCGSWIGPTGQIREISSDAKKIARDIAKKKLAILVRFKKTVT